MNADALRAWRKRWGLTQAQLADALHMSVSQIINYERGASRTRGRTGTIPRTVALAIKALECEMRKKI